MNTIKSSNAQTHTRLKFTQIQDSKEQKLQKPLKHKTILQPPNLKHLQIFSIEMVAIWMQMIGWKRWFAETLLVLIPISMNLIELKPLSF